MESNTKIHYSIQYDAASLGKKETIFMSWFHGRVMCSYVIIGGLRQIGHAAYQIFIRLGACTPQPQIADTVFTLIKRKPKK